MRMLLLSATALVMLGACASNEMTTPGVTETERALCDIWQESLPTRSKADTQQTRDEIGEAYDDFEAACGRPAFPEVTSQGNAQLTS